MKGKEKPGESVGGRQRFLGYPKYYACRFQLHTRSSDSIAS